MRRCLLSMIVMTAYGQLDLVWGDGYGYAGDDDEFFAGQCNGLLGVGPEGVYLNLARSSGPRLSILLHDAPPGSPAEEWEDVVEVSATVPADAQVRWTAWAMESSGDLALPGGDYRLRLSARGRDAAATTPEAPLLCMDVYELDIWPGPPERDAILRVGSRDAEYWHRERGVPH
jgi:hypothetical protein